MKNKTMKILIILVTILSMIIIFGNNSVYALRIADMRNFENDGDLTDSSSVVTDPTENPDYYNPLYVGGASTMSDEPELLEKAGIVLGAINVIGIACSVIILVIIGIKYMLGSIEEKAEYKKSMIPYIIGFVLLLACSSIPNIIYQAIVHLNQRSTFW